MYEKFLSTAGTAATALPAAEPAAARVTATRMDSAFIPGCIFSEAGWYLAPCKEPGLFKHDSGELHMFIGSDLEDPESLCAVIEYQIENDVLTLEHTCLVYVPPGAASGNLEVKSLKKPVSHSVFHLNADRYERTPAAPAAAKGTYTGHVIRRYERVDGTMPELPEGFSTPLLWIDGQKLPGGPYTESLWFHNGDYNGPEPHSHDFDEYIGFLGSDPENPEDLNGEVNLMLGGEKLIIDKSTIVFIPKGLSHSPIGVSYLNRSIIHFSGGNGGSYIREK